MKVSHQHLKNFEHENILRGWGTENQDEVSLVLWVACCRWAVCSLKSTELTIWLIVPQQRLWLCTCYRLLQCQSSAFQNKFLHFNNFQNVSKYCVVIYDFPCSVVVFCPEVYYITWIKTCLFMNGCYLHLLWENRIILLRFCFFMCNYKNEGYLVFLG